MRPTLITGGAGFIGTNVAARLLSRQQPVIVLDNLSRRGVRDNLRWLRSQYPELLRVEVADVRDAAALARIVPQAGAIFHFAAQTAVTTSVTDPRDDFDVNARGTLLLLEAARASGNRVPLVFTSTNKVYGGLGDVALRSFERRYQPVDPELRARGVSEARPLDFHTPYGCSKGSADQYVLEYARGYGLPAIVFRMSCIYGPHQCGNEDQGWVAHFAIRALRGERIAIFGDGMQVRDLLFVEDLVDALLLAREHSAELAGQAFNIGGGPSNAASLLDVLEQLERLHGRTEVEFGPWRPSDQRYYVSDTRRFERATGWRPRFSVERGIAELYAWLQCRQKSRRPKTLPGDEAERPSASHEPT
jgi:CDP-paratose 2-epimerase